MRGELLELGAAGELRDVAVAELAPLLARLHSLEPLMMMPPSCAVDFLMM